jgi:hypothetical protein
VGHARGREVKTFNYKKTIKEIKNNKTHHWNNDYWTGWDDAHDTCIDIIKSNIQEKSLTSAGNKLLDQAAIDKVIQKRHFK